VLVIRKRLATPLTTPMALDGLRDLAGQSPDRAASRLPTAAELASLHGHLQELCGTAADPSTPPLLFTAGLPTISSLWSALVGSGGADVLMCSTAYGGSSQMTDIYVGRTAGKLAKHTFDLQGGADATGSIYSALDALAEQRRRAAKAGRTPLKTVVLFIELPTNPDMKVPDVSALCTALLAFQKGATGSIEVLLLVDTTLAPASRVMEAPAKHAAALPILAFISLSKSVSRGKTTAGALVANRTPAAAALLRRVQQATDALGTAATADQLRILADNHEGVEQRLLQACHLSQRVGAHLIEAVAAATSHRMALCAISSAHEAIGVTASTFSFNLPPPAAASADVCAGLAQRFIDLLTADAQFKPCVSFGQDNGQVYCTVPATSTQGAIKAEDKAKQAMGGVQLARLSFPPSLRDEAAACAVITSAVAAIYGGSHT